MRWKGPLISITSKSRYAVVALAELGRGKIEHAGLPHLIHRLPLA